MDHMDTDLRSRWSHYEEYEPRPGAGWTLTTIVAPNQLYVSNGIRIAPDGRLWITEVNGDQISAWDPATGRLDIADPMGSPMEGPDDLVFDSAGTCFVTETLNNRVSLRAGERYQVLLDDTIAPNGIALDPATDRLFVDEMREGGRVLELDRHELNRYRVIAEGYDWLNGMERGPDGRLYFPQVFSGAVAATDPDDPEVTTVADRFALPTAVKFAADGRLVVADAGTGEVVAVDLVSGHRQPLAAPGPTIDNFCFDAAGALYTSNFVEARVERWDPTTGLRTAVIAPGGLLGPGSIARWDDSALLVADHNSILRVDRDGRIDRLTRLLAGQQFVASAAARIGDELFALTMAGEILAIDPATLATRSVVTTAGSMSEQILGLTSGGASALAASRSALYAAIDGRVVQLDRDGARVREIEVGLDQVDAIAVSADDAQVAACDRVTGTIAVWTVGEVRHHGGLAQPEAVAVLADGVAVSEVGIRQVVLVAPDDRRDVVAADLAIGMPRRSDRRGRSASLYAEDPRTLVIGCDGDGSIRRATAS